MTKIENLIASISEGHAPLTIGFVLYGPTIADVKRWNFNKETHVGNDLIYTTTCWEPGVYHVWVDLIDGQGTVIESGKDKEIIIHVTDKLKNVTLDQWQGVICEGDAIGFSIGTSIPGTPKITWKWGDGQDNSSDDPKFRPNASNPWYKYQKAGSYNGAVTVSGSGITESKEFAVIVLSDPSKTMTGKIEARSLHHPLDTEVFTTNEELTLTAQVSGGVVPKHIVWHIRDFKGKIVNIAGNVGIETKYHFPKSGNYNIECVVRDDVGFKITLLKDVIIRYDHN